LDAFMVHKGLHDMPLDDIDVCFVENVGNLVCPASYDVGTHLNIVLVSVPEGNDKIAKYPVMFRKADLILITKTDLLPYIEYDVEAEKKEARKLKPNVDILEINIQDDDSIKRVIDWIEFKRKMR
ncbi:MAG: hydrogenase accessory protein HypB, partial [Epsilonproteobacteria bacterium]